MVKICTVDDEGAGDDIEGREYCYPRQSRTQDAKGSKFSEAYCDKPILYGSNTWNLGTGAASYRFGVDGTLPSEAAVAW